MPVMTIGRRAIPLLAAAALVPPAPAGAAVVSYPQVDLDVYQLRVSDRDGERNDLVVTPGDHRVLIRERGPAPLEAPAECRRRDARTVSCEGGFVQSIAVRAGAGDDRVVLRGHVSYSTSIAGGEGADRLRATRRETEIRGDAGADLLIGTRSNDVLSGGDGADRLLAGPGHDELHGAAGRDVLDGGRGSDTASWQEHRGPVVIDLGAGRAGPRGTAERLRSIESASGGDGDDVIRGTGGVNHLNGGPGRDALIGRAGDDVLDAGASTARFPSAGPDGKVDVLGCGSGNDLVYDVDLPREPIPRDCERLHSFDATLLDHPVGVQPRPAGAGRVAFRVWCQPDARSCRRRVTVHHGGRIIGRSQLAPARGRRPRAIVPLRAALPTSGIVTVTIDGDDSGDVEAEEPVGRRRFRFVYRLRR